MSGTTAVLVSKGPQDAFLINNNGNTSFFQGRYTRHTNFAQAPKMVSMIGSSPTPGGVSIVPILSYGDLINSMWMHGGIDPATGGAATVTIPGVNAPPGLTGCLYGTLFELFIGGQPVDTHTYDYISDVHGVYLADSMSKSRTSSNFMNFDANVDNTFVPLRFFFCENEMFLPLIALKHTPVELRVTWGPYVTPDVQFFANYVYLDEKERLAMENADMSLIITQVQRLTPHFDPSSSTFGIDLVLNHPVKTIFFGFPAVGLSSTWNFAKADMYLNGTPLFENMYPAYFHTVQGYNHTKYGKIQFSSDPTVNSPFFTQYYMFNFCLDATSYKPTGTCNFSRMENARLVITGPKVTTVSGYTPLGQFNVYAINYNILKIFKGLAGVIFTN